jgi:hypothetical protein
MAKKQDLSNIFSRTEPGDSGGVDLSDLDRGNIKSTGVGLRQGEIDYLDLIGRALGDYMQSEPIPRNALMRLACRRFLVEYKTGSLTLEELAAYFDRPDRPQPKLKL